MNRHLKRLAVTAAALAVTTLQTIPASACGGGGGGISYGGFGGGGFAGGGYSHAAPAPAFHPHQQHFEVAPACPSAQPVYSSTVLRRPLPPQHSSVQRVPSQQVSFSSRGAESAANFGQQAVSQQAVPQQQSAQRLASPQTGLQQSGAQQAGFQQASTRQPATRQNSVASTTPASNVTGNATQQSALQLLASITLDDPQVEPQVEQQVKAQVEQLAEQTAVEIPEFTTASTVPESNASHVGIWSVNLPGNQSVQLELNADGSFKWTATKGDSANSFNGQYRLEVERLTLVRAQDLQQMSGNWSGNDGNFTFKLDGATNSGLAFTRS